MLLGRRAQLLERYEVVRENPLAFVMFNRHRVAAELELLRSPDLTLLPQHLRVFVLAYFRTGRADVAYESAYPEYADKSTEWKSTQGRAVLAKKEVDSIVQQQMAKAGINLHDCFTSLKEMINLNIEGEHSKNLGTLKLKAIETAIKYLSDKSAPEDAEPSSPMEDAKTLEMFKGIEQAKRLEQTRKRAVE